MKLSMTAILLSLVLVASVFAQNEEPAKPGTNEADKPAPASPAPTEQEEPGADENPDVAKPQSEFDSAAAGFEKQLQDAIKEHEELLEKIREELGPLNDVIADRQADLRATKVKASDLNRKLATTRNEGTNLKATKKQQELDDKNISGYIDSYIDAFATSLHVAERGALDPEINKARSARDAEGATAKDVYETQLALIMKSMDRLDDLFGGMRLDGEAIDAAGTVKNGTFLFLGPTVYFRSADGKLVGTAEERANSNEPSVTAFFDAGDTDAASDMVANGIGKIPLDPTMGSAHKIAAAEETWLEHVKKGGKVIYAIGIMAGLALLIALYKFLTFLAVRKPSRKAIDGLLDAVKRRDLDDAQARAGRMKGPIGKMLTAGTEHLGHPSDLVEEVMYETVLTTKLRLNKMLPFIAICAASAPLLGLLGTVTGIIDTFKSIQVFGSGDVKKLSGGISTALITTEYGLIVAIPSLILHAFLSRKARAVVGAMETTAVRFMNQVKKTPFDPAKREAMDVDAPEADQVRARVNEILAEILGVRVPDVPQEKAPTPEIKTRDTEKTQTMREMGAQEAGA